MFFFLIESGGVWQILRNQSNLKIKLSSGQMWYFNWLISEKPTIEGHMDFRKEVESCWLLMKSFLILMDRLHMYLTWGEGAMILFWLMFFLTWKTSNFSLNFTKIACQKLQGQVIKLVFASLIFFFSKINIYMNLRTSLIPYNLFNVPFFFHLYWLSFFPSFL